MILTKEFLFFKFQVKGEKLVKELQANRRERLKSALCLRLKKRKVFENCKRGDPLGFLKIQFVAKYQNN